MWSRENGNGRGARPPVLRATVPLKAGIAGGGSDLPSYYRRRPGRCLNLGLDLSLTVEFDPSRRGRLGFALPGGANTAIGAAMVGHSGLTDHGGLTVACSVMPGCGLGCSSALAVALAALRRAVAGEPAPAAELAEEAWRTEAVALKLPVGKQDHYASSFGGINDLLFDPSRPGPARVRELATTPRGRELAEGGFVIAATGGARQAATILARQSANCRDGRPGVMEAIGERVSLVPAFAAALAEGDVDELATLMRRDWVVKARLDPGVYGPGVEAALDRALDAGALAGRLLGAGGSGYLLLLTRPDRRAGLVEALGAVLADVHPVAPARGGARVTEVR